jgi:hypothetical protein
MSHCLKQYFKFYSDSCWIDSLFVALFHNSGFLIKDFVTKLSLNNINQEQLEIKLGEQIIHEQLEIKLGEQIIHEIKNIYMNHLNINKEKNYNNKIRELLNDHLNLMIQSGKIGQSQYGSFVSKTNNSMDLLKYLISYIFDTDSSNKITSYASNFNDYMNNQKFMNYTSNIEEFPKYKEINFINLRHKISKYSSLLNYELKDNLSNLSLNSIIANVSGHYICYYKCYDKWYKYDDMGIEQYRIEGQIVDRTILIGSLKDVMIDYHDIIKRKRNINSDREEELEFILLYLNLGPIEQRQRLGPGPDPVARFEQRQKVAQGPGPDPSPDPDPSPIARSQEHYRIELARQREIVRQRLIKEAKEREEEASKKLILEIQERESREREEREKQEKSDHEYAKSLRESREREEREKQEKSDHEYAKSLRNQYEGGIRIINDRCNATIKNINDSNCNQKLEKIQKIQYGRDQLIEDMNKFFNKKINKLKN